ncbi:hypothetical protein CEXT_486251 [Caerostris extrusa]|uniref:Uncharacterized protein n=1 Tax=Caerostris extrusa TaxID=172846 RepID=A0AAV4N589_CAEEX|nr:hypothetical protein CEXT_486251 [Caerostris extrusa]
MKQNNRVRKLPAVSKSTIEGQCWEDHEEIPLNALTEKNSSDEVVLLRLTKVILFNSSLGNPVVSKSTIEGQCWKDPVKKETCKIE